MTPLGVGHLDFVILFRLLGKCFSCILSDILKNDIGSSGTRQLDYLGRKFRIRGARDEGVCKVQ
jgi:hypothetical protein